jgi:hypothetical protein
LPLDQGSKSLQLLFLQTKQLKIQDPPEDATASAARLADSGLDLEVVRHVPCNVLSRSDVLYDILGAFVQGLIRHIQKLRYELIGFVHWDLSIGAGAKGRSPRTTWGRTEDVRGTRIIARPIKRMLAPFH